jgi:hypothetical protein
MPVETVSASGLDLTYYLIAFDADGNERTDDPDDPSGRLSQRVRGIVADEPITDVFLMSHGWRADVPMARGQYIRWIRAMAACSNDIAQLRAARPGFRPLLVGLHWPSEPWGNEALNTDEIVFDPTESPVEGMIEQAAAVTADTPAARAALRTIFQAAMEDPSPPSLPPEVQAAYATLNRETGLGSGGPAAAPGDDREQFDAEAIYQDSQSDDVSFGGFGDLENAVLMPLRLLSFWAMKDRGRIVGETGCHQLLKELQVAAGARDVRLHLMGHSFGCIVVSAAVAGPGEHAPLPRPVHSIVLVQGAFSLWSYCTDIPPAPGQSGHFRSIVEDGKIAGPIVVTTSTFDTAVGVSYPKGAGVAGPISDQVSFDPSETPSLPKYGASGTWGLRGPGLQIVDRDLGSATEAYEFVPGTVYNLESSAIIREGKPPSGAHGDILHPEVAHVVWMAARGTA